MRIEIYYRNRSTPLIVEIEGNMLRASEPVDYAFVYNLLIDHKVPKKLKYYTSGRYRNWELEDIPGFDG